MLDYLLFNFIIKHSITLVPNPKPYTGSVPQRRVQRPGHDGALLRHAVRGPLDQRAPGQHGVKTSHHQHDARRGHAGRVLRDHGRVPKRYQHCNAG